MRARNAQGLSVSVDLLASLTPGLVRDWEELADRAVEPNPEFTPQVLLPAARWLARGATVRLATVRDGGQLVLAMPLLADRYRRVPVRAFTTWCHTHRALGTPLVSPDGLAAAPAALLTALGRRRPPGWLVLDQLYLDGPVADAFRAAAADCSASWVEHDVWRRPAIRARDQEDYLSGSLSASSAKTLRRRRRNLERDHGPVELRDAAAGADPESIQAEVEAFLVMETAGWKGQAGTALANDPNHANFWRESCRRLAESGHLRLWQLAAGDKVVARQCDVRWSDTMFHVKTTYDESLAPYSPGVQLDLEILHAFHRDPDLTCLDPSTGRTASGLVTDYPDHRAIGDALIGLTAVGRLTSRLTPVAHRTWRQVKRPDRVGGTPA